MYRTRSLISSLRITFCFLLLASHLAACGFRPIHSKVDSSLASELSSVRVEPVPGRTGQLLSSKLEDLLNPMHEGSQQLYSLRTELERDIRELGIKGDLRVTRYDIILTANYQLVSLADGRVVYSDRSRLKSSYNRTESEFSTFVAEQDANEKAAEELAEVMKSRIAAYFSKE